MPRYSVDAQVWFHVEADNEDEAMHKACEQARIMFADRLAEVDGDWEITDLQDSYYE